jgi:hypothetical protein
MGCQRARTSRHESFQTNRHPASSFKTGVDAPESSIRWGRPESRHPFPTRPRHAVARSSGANHAPKALMSCGADRSPPWRPARVLGVVRQLRRIANTAVVALRATCRAPSTLVPILVLITDDNDARCRRNQS